MKVIAVNKKALFDYEILDSLEVGIVLTGNEVKSLREHGVSLSGCFITVHNGELYLINCSIQSYSKAYLKEEGDVTRRRKLLLHKRELSKLIGVLAQKGLTMLPLKMYLSDKQKIKVALGVGRHKKLVDKKELIKERNIARETRRARKNQS